MILMIDNYDSFTYNLVQYFGVIGEEIIIKRNDQITIEEIGEMQPEFIVISPGPGTPDDAGISLAIIDEFRGEIPIFGVCLGHQCIGQAFGGEIVRAGKIMHGKVSRVFHNNTGVFTNIECPLKATRYHSLIIKKDSFPSDELEITAWTEENEIMGVRSKKYLIEGVQFHPESILTNNGIEMLKNFIKEVRDN